MCRFRQHLPLIVMHWMTAVLLEGRARANTDCCGACMRAGVSAVGTIPSTVGTILSTAYGTLYRQSDCHNTTFSAGMASTMLPQVLLHHGHVSLVEPYLTQCDVLNITCTGCAAILKPARIRAPAPLEPQDHPPVHLVPTQELGNLEQHKQYVSKRWAAHSAQGRYPPDVASRDTQPSAAPRCSRIGLAATAAARCSSKCAPPWQGQ